MYKAIKRLTYPYIVWISIMIVIPVLLIFLYSITINEDGIIQFTLSHYINFFNKSNLLILNKSLTLAIETTIFCLLFGYPVAMIISQMNKSKQNAIILFLILPMWINMLLRTYAWLLILGRHGVVSSLLNIIGISFDSLLYTDSAVLLGMVYNFIPFMILPIYTALIKIDKNLIESANDLGANSIQTFIKVIFPLSLPGVITGIIMVFLPSISSFAIPELLGGGHYVLIGNLIEKQFRELNNWSFGSAISMIIMIFILISMMFMKKNEVKSKSGGALPW